MTQDAPPNAALGGGGDSPATPPDNRVLVAYAARMRRARRRYFATLAVLVAAVLTAVSIAWSRGEIANTTLTTVRSAPPSVPLQVPSATLRQAWTSTDRTAIGTPYWGGTVVTFDQHTVRGRNATTGTQTWSYRRNDRTVCQALQIRGVTVAIYQLHGNCDEVTALSTDTGQRAWTRTLDENGQPIFGRPTYQATQYTFLVITPLVIYAIDPSSGYDRWVFGQQRCTINSAVLGSTGALISQSCDHPPCSGLTYCRNGPQLLLRDPSAGYNNDEKHHANPDQILWNVANSALVPASADQLVSAVDPTTGRLVVLNPDKGTVQTTRALTPAPSAVDAVSASPTVNAELLWVGGVTYAVRTSDSVVMWASRTLSPPTVTATDAASVVGLPDLTQAVLAAPTSNGLTLLHTRSGRPSRNFAVPPPPPGSTAYPYGTGFLVAGPTTTVYR